MAYLRELVHAVLRLLDRLLNLIEELLHHEHSRRAVSAQIHVDEITQRPIQEEN